MASDRNGRRKRNISRARGPLTWAFKSKNQISEIHKIASARPVLYKETVPINGIYPYCVVFSAYLTLWIPDIYEIAN